MPPGRVNSTVDEPAGPEFPPLFPRLFRHAVVRPDVPVVAAPAEIDITVAEQFRAVLLAAAASQSPTVVVDMTSTSFCDSSGVQTLIQAHKRAIAEGGELRLVIPAHGAVARIIDLTGLHRVIPCFVSVAAAVTGRPAPQARGG